jgi:DNA-directed RNA polymerase specialized sigma24 family protein
VSVTEGDDAVQEAWLRLSRSDTRGVQNLGGWLTTVVVREVNFRERYF